MALGSGILKFLLLFLNFGGVQVLTTGKSTGMEIDFKYAVIGTTLGIVISIGFLALKICMIRKHMFDNDSLDTTSRRKNNTRSNLNSSDRDAQVIEL
ncbi:transmembrane protein 273 isoform X2 [Trichosurus vulpecula]|uniref:transmembrane protein 273 isoform X2 n=1 Tax=Trichosurus vulpecula TaxID=9337 RepID=UPI00186B3BEE|nr:transmembrane protein 273 isoform X2 [Trichosurus vulpecula]